MRTEMRSRYCMRSRLTSEPLCTFKVMASTRNFAEPLSVHKSFPESCPFMDGESQDWPKFIRVINFKPASLDQYVLTIGKSSLALQHHSTSQQKVLGQAEVYISSTWAFSYLTCNEELASARGGLPRTNGQPLTTYVELIDGFYDSKIQDDTVQNLLNCESCWTSRRTRAKMPPGCTAANTT
jgi:hypothetical protein